MKLIDDAGTLWHKLWSVRLAIGGSIISAAETASAVYSADRPIWFPALLFAMCAAMGISRVIAQPNATDGNCAE